MSAPGLQRKRSSQAVLGLLCLMILAPFITPIVWAAILAYASWPLYRQLRRLLHGYRTIAALLMTLFLGCVVVVPVLWTATSA